MKYRCTLPSNAGPRSSNNSFGKSLISERSDFGCLFFSVLSVSYDFVFFSSLDQRLPLHLISFQFVNIELFLSLVERSCELVHKLWFKSSISNNIKYDLFISDQEGQKWF